MTGRTRSGLPKTVLEMLGADPRIGPRPEPGPEGWVELWQLVVEEWEAKVREVTRVERLEDVRVGTFFDGPVELSDGTVVRVTYEPYAVLHGWTARGDISETGYQSFAGRVKVRVRMRKDAEAVQFTGDVNQVKEAFPREWIVPMETQTGQVLSVYGPGMDVRAFETTMSCARVRPGKKEPQMLCRYCSSAIEWRTARGWVHADDGKLYRGKCYCPETTHTYSHDDAGSVVCPTWRDHHAAQPLRSS